MTDIIDPPPVRAEGSEPAIDPDLRPLAEASLAALQVTTEAVLARRARPAEFPEPAAQSDLERAIDAEIGRRDVAVQSRAGLAALASLRAPREERRRRFGALGELDMRGRGLADALERMPAAPLPERPTAPEATMFAGTVFDSVGAIEKKYDQFRKQLGPKIGNPKLIKDTEGRTVEALFCKAGAVVRGPKPEAFAVFGKIWPKYETLGGVRAFPGGPPMSDTQTFDDGGQANSFLDNYSIYRGPGLPACEVHGAIRRLYLDLGGRKTVGYPTSDELPVDLEGRVSRFQNGPIVWHPRHDAHWVPASFNATWRAHGDLNGTLGYPVGPVLGNPHTGPASQRFEGGSLVKAAKGAPAVASFPLTTVRLELERVKLSRKTDEGQLKDELHVGGAHVRVDGTTVAVPSIDLGKFKNQQTKNIERVFTEWNVINKSFMGWPLTLVSTVGFWEDDPGGGNGKFVTAIVDALKKVVEKAVEKGIDALGKILEGLAKSKAVGMLVIQILGEIADWVIDKFWSWIHKLIQDDTFEVKPVTWTIADAHSAPNASALLALRVSEVDPDHGKAGIVSSDWRFKTA